MPIACQAARFGSISEVDMTVRANEYPSDAELAEKVLPKYEQLYPEWKGTKITEIIRDTFGGTLVVVRGRPAEIIENEEICYVSSEGGTTIFSTTEELARFLERKARAPWLERFFYYPHISGAAFLLLLLAIFFAGFKHPYQFSGQALSIIGNVAGLAAGFFFGSARRSA
jgi:hypothetical protein